MENGLDIANHTSREHVIGVRGRGIGVGVRGNRGLDADVTR